MGCFFHKSHFDSQDHHLIQDNEIVKLNLSSEIIISKDFCARNFHG